MHFILIFLLFVSCLLFSFLLFSLSFICFFFLSLFFFFFFFCFCTFASANVSTTHWSIKCSCSLLAGFFCYLFGLPIQKIEKKEKEKERLGGKQKGKRRMKGEEGEGKQWKYQVRLRCRHVNKNWTRLQPLMTKVTHRYKTRKENKKKSKSNQNK